MILRNAFTKLQQLHHSWRPRYVHGRNSFHRGYEKTDYGGTLSGRSPPTPQGTPYIPNPRRPHHKPPIYPNIRPMYGTFPVSNNCCCFIDYKVQWIVATFTVFYVQAKVLREKLQLICITNITLIIIITIIAPPPPRTFFFVCIFSMFVKLMQNPLS